MKTEGARSGMDPAAQAVMAGLVLFLVVGGVAAVAALTLWNTAEKDRAARPTWSLAQGETVQSVPVTLVEVLDGDTAFFRLSDGSLEKVRLIGVDAPEVVDARDPYTRESKQHARELLRGSSQLYLERGVKERDRYGQLLAYVWLVMPSERPTAIEVRDNMLNARMLVDGFAREFPEEPGVTYENTKYSTLLKAYANQAQVDQIGFWSPTFAKGSDARTGWAGAPAVAENPKPAADEITSPFLGNATSKKFHFTGCENAQEMRLENHVPLESRQQAIDLGFVPCGVCEP